MSMINATLARLSGFAPLVLRVAVGGVMAYHGFDKLRGGMDGVEAMFKMMEVPAPAVTAPLVTALEIVGGLALIVGIGTREERRRDAFTAYVLPEIGVLLRVARTLVPRPADAEDLIQDTLLRAFRSMESFDGRHPRAWLLTIMRNAQVNRTRRRRPELLDDPDAAERLGDHGGPAASPEAIVVGETFDAVVVDSLDALPERFRQVVVLVDIEGSPTWKPLTSSAFPRDGDEPAASGTDSDQGQIGGSGAGAEKG